tara:strand:+ start:469 stop:585 length:117 start_codon:yes stop_codon:yes gene_type:complete
MTEKSACLERDDYHFETVLPSCFDFMFLSFKKPIKKEQ